MAGVSTKEIKNRIRSMESTKQITKAMEMVAASKLRRAQAQISNSRPYFQIFYSTIQDILRANRDFQSPYLKERPVNKRLYIVIAGDRGLAGGYNTNVFKTVAAHAAGKDCCYLPVGKKALEHYLHQGADVLSREFGEAEEVSVGQCFSMARTLAKGFLSREFDEIYVGYTNFVSMLTQTPAVLRLLPLNPPKAKAEGPQPLILYEPDSQAVYDAIVPEYVAGLIYGALCESVASELGARRTAMDAASKNAGEMIDTLSLHYNRARQAAITQEITEIVAGGEA